MGREITVNKTYVAFALMFASAAFAGNKKDVDQTVFGLHLGDKFSVPECAREKSSSGLLDRYKGGDPSLCFRLDAYELLSHFVPPDTPVLNNQQIKLDFAKGVTEMTLNVSAKIIDGNFEGVLIITSGLKSQDELLTMLREKYGDPSDFQEEKKETAGGGVFESHLAIWRFDNFVVTFGGTADRTDSGFIAIETKKQQEFVRAWREKRNAVAPKL